MNAKKMESKKRRNKRERMKGNNQVMKKHKDL